MNKFYRIALFASLIILAHGASASGLRVTCDGEDLGAEVQINGKFKGECPVDITIPEGTYKLRVFKTIDATQELVFEQTIRMGDGVMKKVEAVLTPQLTAAGQKLEAERLAAEARREADLWNTVENASTSATVQAYIEQYPAGLHIAAAKEKIAALLKADAAVLVMIPIPGKNYEIGKTEVTQAQWQAIMGSNPSHFTSCGDTCPVEYVSWDDIQLFLQNLNAKTGKQYRLPTEVEWEYACYGGSKTEYCGGNDLNAVGWFNGNSNYRTRLVGQKQANGYGLVDMTGNVWEWQSDYYDGFFGSGYVLRGGSSGEDSYTLRVSYMLWNKPAIRHALFGFRLARTLP